MLLLMPLAPYWNARALQTCVRVRLLRHDVGSGREAGPRKGQGRKVRKLYARDHDAQYTMVVVIAVFAAVA
jgi:hypothetical protein